MNYLIIIRYELRKDWEDSPLEQTDLGMKFELSEDYLSIATIDLVMKVILLMKCIKNLVDVVVKF